VLLILLLIQMHPGLGDSLEGVIHFLFDAKALEVYTSSSLIVQPLLLSRNLSGTRGLISSFITN
jgi:hypothetical protein